MADKYLIIGSNSFSGSSFVDFLLEQGHSVMGASRSPELHRVFLPYRWNGNDHSFKFYNYDLNTNLEEIVSLVKREKPPFVINFAAQSMVAQSWENPDHWFMTNVVSTIRLHDRLRKFDFLEKYIHVTTPEVYGSTNGFIKENTPFSPSTPYAVSRAATDMSLRTFFEAYKFPVVFTRASNVYGPGQQLYRIIPRTILSVLSGKKLRLHGGGHSKRSFIHFRDVANATHKIAEQGVAGETYHISTNEIVTIRELVAKICQKLGADFGNCVEIVGERLGKDEAYMLDSSKVRQELDWNDQISLNDGLDSCIEWVKSNIGELGSMHWDYLHKP